MLTLAVFIGLWTSTCIQTQISGNNEGFVKESYSIEETGNFEFKREWFKDPQCSDSESVDVELGTIRIGKKLSGMFITGEAYEANFSTETGTDLGAISLAKKDSVKIARGMKNSSMRNTMLGLFEYKKQ